MQKDMTKGNPMPIILQFTWPLFLGNVFQQVYNAVDSMIVGRFVGSGALAAVGSTGTIMFLVIGAATGLSTGFTVLTSQRYGIHDEEGIKKSVANGMLLSAAVIILMTVSSLLGMKGILRLLNTPENIFEDAYTYISIICAGIIASVAYNFFSACLRAIGNSKVPLVTLIFSACLNVVLDLALIVGLKMGVAGAALATIISRGRQDQKRCQRRIAGRYRLFCHSRTGSISGAACSFEIFLRERNGYDTDHVLCQAIYSALYSFLYSAVCDLYFQKYHAGLRLWVPAYDGRCGRAACKDALRSDRHEGDELFSCCIL